MGTWVRPGTERVGGGESDPAEGKGEERPQEVRSHGTSHADSDCGPHATMRG